MDARATELLRRLLTETRVLTLVVEVEGERTVGVLPFLACADLRSMIVHSSRLAKHTRGLADGALFSAAIHEPDRPDADPLALPRLLFNGRSESIASDELRRIETAWVDRFPSAIMTIGLGDFEFRRLRIEGGRMIAGFAQAFAIGSAQLDAAANYRPA
jgi:hypothetical protein